MALVGRKCDTIRNVTSNLLLTFDQINLNTTKTKRVSQKNQSKHHDFDVEVLLKFKQFC